MESTVFRYKLARTKGCKRGIAGGAPSQAPGFRRLHPGLYSRRPEGSTTDSRDRQARAIPRLHPEAGPPLTSPATGKATRANQATTSSSSSSRTAASMSRSALRSKSRNSREVVPPAGSRCKTSWHRSRSALFWGKGWPARRLRPLPVSRPPGLSGSDGIGQLFRELRPRSP
jgi:hypothetical protein